MADPTEPNGPLWWLAQLESKLRQRRWRTKVYDDYYAGRHRLQFATPKFRATFGGLFNEFADDWCELVADAPAQRLTVTGFRMGDEATEADKEAWKFWQYNGLDSGSRMGHIESIVREESAVIVWQDPTRDDIPKISVEDPDQVYVAFTDSTRTKRAAALKMWVDNDGYEYATVYLPDFIYKYRSKTVTLSPLVSGLREWAQDRPGGGGGAPSALWLPSSFTLDSSTWQPRVEGNEPWPLPNPLKVVPVVPLTNRPRLNSGGRSEIQKVIPLQDAVNKLISDMLISSEYQAFRQRWAIGIDIPKDDKGNAKEDFLSAIDRVWMNENPAGKFGDFNEVSLSNFTNAIEMIVEHIAATTSTPRHYFYLKGNPPSGEAIKSAEAGLVAKVYDKMLHLGEAWEEVIRLGFAVIDDNRSEIFDSETIWKDPELRTESQHVDAAIKLLAVGVPQQVIWERLGFTSTEIRRFKDLLREQVAEQAALAASLGGTLGSTQPVVGHADAVGINSADPAARQGGTAPEFVPGAPVQPQLLPERFRL